MLTTESRDTTRSMLDGRTTRRLLLWGVTVWFAVAVLVRFAGHVLLDPSNPGVVLVFFVSVVPLMALVTYPIYWWFEIPFAARGGAAAVLSLPGMLLDVLLVLSAEAVFPDMTTGAVVNFGAILLFGYAVVLLTGFVSVRRQ